MSSWMHKEVTQTVFILKLRNVKEKTSALSKENINPTPTTLNTRFVLYVEKKP
jgi:hypothetical protein